MTARAERAPAGFTLIEALVALIIAGLVLALFLGTLRGGLRGIAEAEHRAEALSLARSWLDAAGIITPLRPGLREGDAAPGYRWRQQVTLRERRAEGLSLYDVRVDITWDDAGSRHAVGLTTLLIAGPGGLVP